MLDIYYCEECDRYFTEEQMEEKEIYLEGEYGIGGDFPTRTYARVGCCPYCESTDYQECDDAEEIVDILNTKTRR